MKLEAWRKGAEGMVVTSPVFLIFSAAAALAVRFMPVRFRAAFLLAASLFAYGCWKPWAPLFLTGYAAASYLLAFLIRKRPKAGFVAALAFNVALFAVLGQAGAFRFSGAQAPAFAEIILPLGFSYYMFRCIGYHADVALGRLAPERDPLKLALFLCFYPILVMGPVTRAGDFLPQIEKPKHPGARDIRECSFLIGLSLVKKFVFADNIGRLIAPWFEESAVQSGGVWFVLLFCYLIQLYLDFSAYTDIALSVSRLLGFSVNPNFRAPFLSRSISEFWRRWHMGLSHWLSDYLFTPLQLKLRGMGVWASVIAAFVTLTVSGLWHRVSWNYVAWGLVTAFFISMDALFAKRRKKIAKAVPKWLFTVVTTTVTFVLSVWIITFIRAEDFGQSLYILGRVFDPGSTNLRGMLDFFGEGGELLWYTLAALPLVTLSHALELKPLEPLLRGASRIPYPVWAVLTVLLIYAFIFFGWFDSDIVGGFIYAKF